VKRALFDGVTVGGWERELDGVDAGGCGKTGYSWGSTEAWVMSAEDFPRDDRV